MAAAFDRSELERRPRRTGASVSDIGDAVAGAERADVVADGLLDVTVLRVEAGQFAVLAARGADRRVRRPLRRPAPRTTTRGRRRPRNHHVSRLERYPSGDARGVRPDATVRQRRRPDRRTFAEVVDAVEDDIWDRLVETLDVLADEDDTRTVLRTTLLSGYDTSHPEWYAAMFDRAGADTDFVELKALMHVDNSGTGRTAT